MFYKGAQNLRSYLRLVLLKFQLVIRFRMRLIDIYGNLIKEKDVESLKIRKHDFKNELVWHDYAKLN
ncbi:hypothetical protein ASU28_01140 [Lactiplantibacillus paraplantarum]|nr:hypothetical protein ASU28_01140 [Lactiplantibacillus paraplantarum]KGE74868.1 hypothetical protein HR47_09475 [Lactiplantibacillus paraplantarum]MCT4458478.1 hypothetical protein [Lactiplantibacillus paraplantarum]OAX75781.1 hypothetical protein A0U96_05760 [Lactiplantibacillus plantarum]RDG09982.1 hypothetical protein DQM08_12115 [Lactiplantibacillus paraplantarum]